MTNNQLKAMLASYGRSVLASASALYLAGLTDPLDLAYSLIAGAIPVFLRAVNPNDPAFGILPDAKDLDKALRSAKARKAPIKKTVAKKTTKK